jgi:hypothetical protein
MAQQSTQASAPPTIVKYPRWLIVDATVGANTSSGQNLQIPNDADFEWWWMAAFRTSGSLKVLISEAGTQRSFIYPQQGVVNQANFNGMYIDMLAGLVANNGAFPIAVPFVLPGSRLYVHTFTDSSGASNTVELAYIGYALLQIAASS